MAWSELMNPETWLPILTHPDQSISSSLLLSQRVDDPNSLDSNWKRLNESHYQVLVSTIFCSWGWATNYSRLPFAPNWVPSTNLGAADTDQIKKLMFCGRNQCKFELHGIDWDSVTVQMLNDAHKVWHCQTVLVFGDLASWAMVYSTKHPNIMRTRKDIPWYPQTKSKFRKIVAL